jgi:uncharacterized protein
VAEEVTYHNDLKEGPWIQYFTDGTIKMKTAYLHDQIEGLYLIYGLKGNVEVSGSYLHSNKTGTWVYFNDDGVLLKKEEYENGRLINQEIMVEEK